MAQAVVTLKIMPESPSVDIESLAQRALKEVLDFNGNKETRIAIEPIAFGLKAVNITFVMDEAKGSPDVLADRIALLDDVNSAQIVDVRRAIG